MHFKEGNLEATSDVRSVPLGEKRRKGRPKNIPTNCLTKSPVSQRVETVPEAEEIFENEEVSGVKKTTRKRRHPVDVDAPSKKKRKIADIGVNDLEVDHSPIQILHSQSYVQSGLGSSKPPKKRCKMATRTSKPSSKPPISSKPPAASQVPTTSKPLPATNPSGAPKPPSALLIILFVFSD